jgi:hypothetical protein
MGQQLNTEDALEAFRKRHGELADENVLLRGYAAGLERRVTELVEENERLKGAQQQPAEPPQPFTGMPPDAPV